MNERFDEILKLLFDISSSDRLTLLFAIRKENLRLTHLAEKISATTQETSRHLGRLTDAKLIEKNSDGFNITNRILDVLAEERPQIISIAEPGILIESLS